jgi:excisionase family DNA binding protein
VSDSELRTVAQASAHLAQSRTTIFKLIKSGELASVKIGKSRRIPVSALDDFVARRTAN